MEKDFLQLYREETKRLLWSNAAMDRSRNLAILILVAMVLVSFGFAETTSHRVSYFGSLAVFVLIFFEARLFRSYAVTNQRIEWLESKVNAATKNKQDALQAVPPQQLALAFANVRRPSFINGIAHRIYTTYFLIFLVLDTCWLLKVYLSPQPSLTFSEFVHRLDLGFFSGWATVAFMAVFWGLFIFISVRIRAMKKQNIQRYE